MNLTAMTVTVYFVGLVNFSGTGTTREVVAPRAPAATLRTVAPLTKTMEPHRADIFIKNMKDPTKCPGRVIMDGSDEICFIKDVLGTVVKLPSSSASLTIKDGFKNNIPKLRDLCGAISGINPQYLSNSQLYAVRLTLESGDLDACADGLSWGSHLTLNATNDILEIGSTSLQLDDKAVIHIMNHPLTHGTMSGEEHFWWYYVMSQNASTCKDIPAAASGGKCPPPLVNPDPQDPDLKWMFATTGPGCSNSNYP